MMKDKARMRYIVPISASLICLIMLLEIYLESLCANYAGETYNFTPLYGMKNLFCLIWALIARIYIAIRRKRDCKGRIAVDGSSVITFILLLVIGVVDYYFLTKKLFWSQAYKVMLLLSVLCSVMRKKNNCQ